MEVLGIVLAVALGLFVLTVAVLVISVFVMVFKGFRRVSKNQAVFDKKWHNKFYS